MTIESTLPSSWYLDDEIFALEREYIFMCEWLCVGREEQLEGPGDHRVLDLYGESILLLRNSEGELRAFFNVCRHRGARLCVAQSEQQSDNLLPLRGGLIGGRSIMCPYHAWSYDLDGRLQRMPHVTPEMGLDPEELSLHAVALECWGGFIFINLTPEAAQPLLPQIASTIDLFQRYPMAELRIGKSIHYEVEANWKVICENYNECYHCGPVHPELCEVVPAFKQGGGAGLDWERGIPHRDGAVTFTASGTTHRHMFPGLNEDEQVRHKGDLVYPNLFISAASDHIAAFILHARGAGHCSIDCHFLFEAAEVEKSDFDPSDAVDFWHTVNRQDWSICARVQQGLSSRVHDSGIFSPMEDWNLDIRRYVSDRIGPYIPV